MLRWIIFLLIAGFVKCIKRNRTIVIPEVENRIYSGAYATIDDYSYAVFLHFDVTSPSSCGGSLIFSQVVVTAAHCLDELRLGRGQVHTYFGSTVPSRSTVVRRVVDIRINPKYKERTGDNNLGVAFLNSRVPLGSNIKKIPLAADFARPDMYVYSVGWGKQQTGEVNKIPDLSIQRTLQATRQRIETSKRCDRYAGIKLSHTSFCSVPEVGHFYKDDAGNGLIEKSPTTALLGVLSYVANGVSVFTGVLIHKDWIRDSCYSMFVNNCHR